MSMPGGRIGRVGRRLIGGVAWLCAAAWSGPTPAHRAGGDSVLDRASRALLPFVENAGQFADPAIRFAARTWAGAVYVMDSGGLVYVLPGADGTNAAVVAERWAGAGPASVRGGARAAATASFFYGRDPAGWRTGIPSFESVECRSIFPGIDLAVRARGRTVEKVFTLAPGADPGALVAEFEGAERLRIDESGALVVATALGEARFSAPVAFQAGPRGPDPVPVRYWADGTRCGFTLGDYDPDRALVIDPLLAGTYLGGYRWDQAQALAVDGSGRVYVAGFTGSADFPVTPGVVQPVRRGTDAFVSRFDPALTNLLASTFLGGSHVQAAYALALGPAGRVGVAGSTASSDFPVTGTAFQRTLGSPDTNDLFVAVLDAGLTRLLASTLLGGDETEDACAVEFDGAGAVYVAGVTRSTNAPLAPGAFQAQLKGWGDGYLARLSPDLDRLLAATCLGGSGYDRINDVSLDAAGDVFVAGITGGGFPTTNTPYCSTFGGGEVDGFVAKFNPALNTLYAATYLGGAGEDWPMTVIPDTLVRVGGHTFSADFPTTPLAFQPAFGGGTNDAFLCALSPGLTSLEASTFLGGSGYDFLESMARGPDGSLWAAGYTGSPDFPTGPGAYNRTLRGTDAFVARLDASGRRLVASTFLGGSWDDWAHAIGLGPDGQPWVAGYTESLDFPVLPGAVGPSYHVPTVPNHGDAFVARLDAELSDRPAPPLRVTAGAGTRVDHVRVAWWPADQADGYIVWRTPGPGLDGAVAVTNVDAGVTLCRDWAVRPGVPYWYRVTAVNASGSSAFSAAARGWRSPVHPLAADFDGDGKADPAVVSNGQWFIWMSGAGYRRLGPALGSPPSGAAAAGDFDGDGLADPASADPVSGAWRIWRSRQQYRPVGPVALRVGRASALAADFDGDGLADPALVAGTDWRLWMSSVGFRPSLPLTLGLPDMVPVSGDFDGDGLADVAGVLDGGWYIWGSRAFYERAGPFPFGAADDLPVAADFDGDGKTDPAVYRPAAGAWTLWLSGARYARSGPYPLRP